MVSFRIGEGERGSAGGYRDVFPFLEEPEVSAGNHETGMAVADEITLAGQKLTGQITAFHTGVTGAVQAAETGQAVAFPMDPDLCIPADEFRFAVEGAQDGAGIAVDSGSQAAAGEKHVGGAGHGAYSGGPFTGGGEIEIAGHPDFSRAGMGSDEYHVIAFHMNSDRHVVNFNMNITGGRTDAGHRDAGSREVDGAAADEDAFAGADAAADAGSLVPGGTDDNCAGRFEVDGAEGVIAVGTKTDGIVPCVMHKEIAAAADGQTAAARNDDPIPVQRIVAGQIQKQAAVVAYTDAGLC